MGDKILKSKLMLMSKLSILGKTTREKFCFLVGNAQITYPLSLSEKEVKVKMSSFHRGCS